jgi:hypothetical protein
MNPTIKLYLISSATTFIATFLIAGGVGIQNGALGGQAVTASVIVGHLHGRVPCSREGRRRGIRGHGRSLSRPLKSP